MVKLMAGLLIFMCIVLILFSICVISPRAGMIAFAIVMLLFFVCISMLYFYIKFQSV